MKNLIVFSVTTFISQMILRHKSFSMAFCFFLLLTAVAAPAQNNPNSSAMDKAKSLTGVWTTEAPVLYLVEYTDLHPQGESVPHEKLQILKRTATMQWTLEMGPDGLLVGTNDWVAYDENDQKVFEGKEALLGAYDGQSGFLIEPADDENQSAQIKFEFRRQGQQKITGLAYSIGSPKLLAMQFVLVRK